MKTPQQGHDIGSHGERADCGEQGIVQNARTSLFISHTLDRRYSR